MTHGSGSGPTGPGQTQDATADTLASGAAITAPRAADAAAYEELIEVDPQHYRLEGELARGGMGRIVIARDRRLDRQVALKLLREDTATLRGRFEREVRITAKL